jgi:hypothetical protein
MVMNSNSTLSHFAFPSSPKLRRDIMIMLYSINLISEVITLTFDNITSARDMWLALLNRFEGDTQIKRTKNMGLETKF